MKCPRCGTDLEGKDLCPGCGKKVKHPPGIEVEYKDFKLSEYLEIRRKEQGGKPEDVPAGVQEGEKPAVKPAKATHGPGEGTGGIPERPSWAGRRPFFVAAVVLLLLAVLAGALYLWRFLKP